MSVSWGCRNVAVIILCLHLISSVFINLYFTYNPPPREHFHLFFPLTAPPHHEILIPQLYCISVYVLYVYLCFIHKKSKIISLSKNEFHPLTGNIVPIENAWIKPTSFLFQELD